jgi:hypothetical protein
MSSLKPLAVLSVCILLSMGLLLPGDSTAQDVSFQQVELKTLDKQKFVFPDDLRATKVNIVLLALSEEQENGSWQGDALVEWYAALESEGVLSTEVMAWHFSVLKVPFFVKGLIRGGMADTYKGKLPPSQAGPVFVKNVPEFAAQAGIALDGQPNIVLVAPSGEILQAFKGEVSPELLAQVVKAVSE